MPESCIGLLKAVSAPLSTFNAGIKRQKADRVFGRMEEQAFRNAGKDKNTADKWDYISDDDDVLVVVSEDIKVQSGRHCVIETVDSFVLANVIDTALIGTQAPRRKKALTDVDLMFKNPRARIPIDEPKGAVWLRKYKEATSTGSVLEGYQNSRRAAPSVGREAQKYFKLPIETGEPLQWYGAAAVLGHVRMSRVDGLSLCYSRVEKDYNDLVKKYHDELATRKEECKCRSCK